MKRRFPQKAGPARDRWPGRTAVLLAPLATRRVIGALPQRCRCPSIGFPQTAMGVLFGPFDISMVMYSRVFLSIEAHAHPVIQFSWKSDCKIARGRRGSLQTVARYTGAVLQNFGAHMVPLEECGQLRNPCFAPLWKTTRFRRQEGWVCSSR